LTGATGALPIWVELMRRAEAGGAPVAPVPREIVKVMIDPQSGQRATRNCPEVVEETFLRGTEPRERCELHEGRFRRWFRRLTGKRSGEVI
jgi:penicillin-binding protein 1B